MSKRSTVKRSFEKKFHAGFHRSRLRVGEQWAKSSVAQPIAQNEFGGGRKKEATRMAVSAEFVAQVTKSQRHLHAFILSMVWNPAEAVDVLQETNLVLWEKVTEFDASRPFLP